MVHQVYLFLGAQKPLTDEIFARDHVDQAGFLAILDIIIDGFSRYASLFVLEVVHDRARRKGVSCGGDEIEDEPLEFVDIANMVALGYVLQNDRIEQVVQILQGRGVVEGIAVEKGHTAEDEVAPEGLRFGELATSCRQHVQNFSK